MGVSGDPWKEKRDDERSCGILDIVLGDLDRGDGADGAGPDPSCPVGRRGSSPSTTGAAGDGSEKSGRRGTCRRSGSNRFRPGGAWKRARRRGPGGQNRKRVIGHRSGLDRPFRFSSFPSGGALRPGKGADPLPASVSSSIVIFPKIR